MIAEEVAKLICILKKENETNSEEDRTFNNEWIRLLHISWSKALDKKYNKKT